MVSDSVNAPILFAADDYVGAPTSDSVDFHIEKIAAVVHKQLSPESLSTLKEKFFVDTGKFFPEDECYHSKISYFLDCLFFEDWLISSELPRFNGKIPFNFLDVSTSRDISLPVIAAHHSLFVIKKIKPTQLLIRDLMTPKRDFIITPRAKESFAALNRGDIAQGFVYETASGFFLSRSIFFHPQRAEGHIKKFSKKYLKGESTVPLEGLQQLARLHIRQLRHRHVDPKQIYAVLNVKVKKGATAFG